MLWLLTNALARPTFVFLHEFLCLPCWKSMKLCACCPGDQALLCNHLVVFVITVKLQLSTMLITCSFIQLKDSSSNSFVL